MAKTVGDTAIQQMQFAYKVAKRRLRVVPQGPHRSGAESLVYAVLTEDLAAPTSIYSTPTSAIAQRLVQLGDIGTNLSLAGGAGSTDEANLVRVWNHDPDFDAVAGTPVICGWVLGELMVLNSGGGGSGTEIIAFQIVTADCAAREAEVNVLAVSCENASVDVGDTLTVIDLIGCFFGSVDSVLIDLKGYATKMARSEDWPGEGDDCQWHVIALCCPTEMC